MCRESVWYLGERRVCRGRESSGTPHNRTEREASTDRQWTRAWFVGQRGAEGARLERVGLRGKRVPSRYIVVWRGGRVDSRAAERMCRARSYGHIERKQNSVTTTTRHNPLHLSNLSAAPNRTAPTPLPSLYTAHPSTRMLTPAPAPAPDCCSQQSGPPRSRTPPHSGYRVRAPDPALGRWLTDRSRTRQEASR